MFGRGARAAIVSEPGALAAELPCGSARAVPLGGVPMAVHTIGIGLGDVLLQTARSTPVALLGTLSRATVLLVLPLQGREAVALNGLAVKPRRVAAFGAGAKYEAASPRACAWATVALPAATAAALLGRRRLPPALRPGAHALLRASPGAWTRAAALARDACEVAARDPGVFDVEKARRALRAAVIEAADELLASPDDEREPVPTRRARMAHRRLVRLVDDHVTAAPARIPGVAELSAALGVSERQMREAFAGVLGVSPSRYLRLRRLVLVRAALRSPGRSWASVREAALAHGFWHLGRFARIYRDAFGEPPSTTLGRVPDRAGAAGLVTAAGPTRKGL
jgi:AraC family transcriptional regulator, ethanolamine operon transcriptional activator